VLSFFGLLFIVSCKNQTEVENAIADINIDVSVERFDQFFGNAQSSDLPRLKQAYPFLFPEKYNDAFWIAKLEDSLQKELIRETGKAYQNFDAIEQEIEGLFKRFWIT